MKTDFFLHARNVGGAVVVALGFSGTALVSAQSLAPYFISYQTPGAVEPGQALPPNGFPPVVRIVGGGVNPPPFVTSAGSFERVERFVAAERRESRQLFQLLAVGLFENRAGTFCGSDYYVFRSPMSPQTVLNAQIGYLRGAECSFTRPVGAWSFTDRVTLSSPKRRTAIDGSAYDATAITIVRNGVPWITYFAGYRLGVVAGESNWIAGGESLLPALISSPESGSIQWPSLPNASNNFELVRLPPPFVEGEVVEYVNTAEFPRSPGGYFFYTANRNEQDLLESSTSWWRTSNTFKSGGYLSVCRFFGGPAPTLKRHVFSADETECKRLRADSAYNDEGLPFRASLQIPASVAAPATCPAGTVPLYRAYNQATGQNLPENYRYATNKVLFIDLLGNEGWRDAGVAMCVPE